MTYVIGETCVDVLDRACVEECPVDCIYEGERMLYIHPDECVDCGACEPVCPVEAIYYEDDVPDQWKSYTAENARFFAEPLPGRDAPLGSPGGAARLGAVGADTPVRSRTPAPRHSRQEALAASVAIAQAGLSATDPGEAVMAVIIYGDFNCPYSYLASQRADLLGRMGIEVDWRAVEHDRSLPLTGSRADGERAAWDRELADIASLALPWEHVPAGPPVLISNTQAAVSAYAEAIGDGVAGELRRRVYAAIWADGLHLSSAHEVRRLVTAVMWPKEDITARLYSPEFPSRLTRDPDLAQIVRRSGGTVAPDGQPLTTTGWRRIRQWRQEWLELPSQVIPAVIGPDQGVRSGLDALDYLAHLASRAPVVPHSRSAADTMPDRDWQPLAPARAA